MQKLINRFTLILVLVPILLLNSCGRVDRCEEIGFDGTLKTCVTYPLLKVDQSKSSWFPYEAGDTLIMISNKGSRALWFDLMGWRLDTHKVHVNFRTRETPCGTAECYDDAYIETYGIYFVSHSSPISIGFQVIKDIASFSNDSNQVMNLRDLRRVNLANSGSVGFPIVDNASDMQSPFFAFQHRDSLDLFGRIFTDVIQTDYVHSSHVAWIKRCYVSKSLGLIGFEQSDGEIWRIE